MENLYDSNGLPLTPVPIAQSDLRQAMIKLAATAFEQGAYGAFEIMEMGFRKCSTEGRESLTIDQCLTLLVVLKAIIDDNVKKYMHPEAKPDLPN